MWTRGFLISLQQQLEHQKVALAIFPCTDCSAVFESANALQSHISRKHQHRNPMRKFVRGPECPVCLQRFWQRERVIHHLKRSVCGRLAAEYIQPCTIAEMLELDQQAAGEARAHQPAGRHSRFAALPCVRTQGPRARAEFYAVP